MGGAPRKSQIGGVAGLKGVTEALYPIFGTTAREGEQRVLFLRPFALDSDAEEEGANWSKKEAAATEITVKLFVGEPIVRTRLTRTQESQG